MAYSKSRSAYPAWLQALIPTYAEWARNKRSEQPPAITLPTREAATQTRYQIYGFTNILETQGNATEQEQAKFMREYSLLVRPREDGQFDLIFRNKNSADVAMQIFDVISQMEEAIAQTQNERDALHKHFAETL